MEIKVLGKEQLRPSLALVVGTRPGIVMFAPIIRALSSAGLAFQIIHAGQHYSPNMDEQFFSDLKLPRPDFRVAGVAERRTHGGQTAAMLDGIEQILLDARPAMVVVGGDANTNLAGALAARKIGISVAHVEAGERSYDWSMPEEHNRRMIDHISDLLFATGERAAAHLRRESVQGQIEITGNPIVDASLQNLVVAEKSSRILSRFELSDRRYAVLTLHREENVDNPDRLENALFGVNEASGATGIPVVFPVHPRTAKRLSEFGLSGRVASWNSLHLIDPLGYLDFLKLVAHSALIYTDSGGVQQEACVHHVPCVTLRANTEWTETLDIGANQLAGTDPTDIVSTARRACSRRCEWSIPFGDGHSAEKIAACLKEAIG